MVNRRFQVMHLAHKPISESPTETPFNIESNIVGLGTDGACREVPTQQFVLPHRDKSHGDSKVLPYNGRKPVLGHAALDVSESCVTYCTNVC